MVVRINRLWDAEIRAALTHGFQITVKAFILCQEKSDDLPGSIIDSTMKGVFDISPKPLVRRGIDLDELSGMGLTFAPMCAVSDFFLFRALLYKSGKFELHEFDRQQAKWKRAG